MTIRTNEYFQRRLADIRARCGNPKHIMFKYYGGRGIQCLITWRDIRDLWKRDDADHMKKPTIDRIDNDSSYIFDNCRYIEAFENTRRGNSVTSINARKTECKHGHLFTEKNTIIHITKKHSRHRNCRCCKQKADRKRYRINADIALKEANRE